MGASGGFEKFFGSTQAIGLKNIYDVSSSGEVAFAAEDNEYWIIRLDASGKTAHGSSWQGKICSQA